MRETTRCYMATIEGKPAHWDGEMLCFADELPHWQDRPAPVQVVRQLRTVKRWAAQSLAFRKRHGFGAHKYGWCVVEVPR